MGGITDKLGIHELVREFGTKMTAKCIIGCFPPIGNYKKFSLRQKVSPYPIRSELHLFFSLILCPFVNRDLPCPSGGSRETFAPDSRTGTTFTECSIRILSRTFIMYFGHKKNMPKICLLGGQWIFGPTATTAMPQLRTS